MRRAGCPAEIVCCPANAQLVHSLRGERLVLAAVSRRAPGWLEVSPPAALPCSSALGHSNNDPGGRLTPVKVVRANFVVIEWV